MADVVHLLRSDIIGVDHEALVVLTQEAVQAGDVLFLTGSGKRHVELMEKRENTLTSEINLTLSGMSRDKKKRVV